MSDLILRIADLEQISMQAEPRLFKFQTTWDEVSP